MYITATAIPNATISWWYNKIEIGREDKDSSFQIIGKALAWVSQSNFHEFRPFKGTLNRWFVGQFQPIIIEFFCKDVYCTV